MLKDNKITDKVDCWSLGIIMYQLLTRQFPFDSNSTITTNSNDVLSWPHIRQWILEGPVEFQTDPVPSKEGNPPPRIQMIKHTHITNPLGVIFFLDIAMTLVENLLAKDPRHRFSAGQAFADPYVELGLSKTGLFEQYKQVIHSHFDRLSSAASSFAPSSSPRPHHHSTSPKHIKLGKDICLPGNKQQRDGFDHWVERAPQPRYFENGQRIV
jgi:serine/threonine protein kinase